MQAPKAPAPSPTPTTSRDAGAGRGQSDNRTSSVRQREFQEAIASSPRMLAQQGLQEAINNSPRMVAQRQRQEEITNSPRMVAQRQRAEASAPRTNTTGLPDQLKAGVENLSGYSLDDVQVHYNSSKPAQLQAHAYAQGADIHVAPGQEKHLPHEAWHVVQQKQGRVRATTQLKGVGVNEDSSLEKEADVMGTRAMHTEAVSEIDSSQLSIGHPSKVQQYRKYHKGEIQPPQEADVRYSVINLFGIPATKRMQARNVNYRNIAGGTDRGGDFENHSALYKAIHGFYPNIHDMHLLHQGLGGEGRSPNLVPGPPETNNNMMDFEQAVISMVNGIYEFSVVDYEVVVNYGRSGNDRRAIMPTSVDMRVTEKKSEDNGATWVDDNVVFARNVAIVVQPIDDNNSFGAPDDLAAPQNEQDINDNRPVERNGSSHRTMNTEFGDKHWARHEINKTSDARNTLRHFKDHHLINPHLKDASFLWDEQQLEDLLNQRSLVGIARIQQNIANLGVSVQVQECLNEIYRELWDVKLEESIALSVGTSGVPLGALRHAAIGVAELVAESANINGADAEEHFRPQVSIRIAEESLIAAQRVNWLALKAQPILIPQYTQTAQHLVAALQVALPHYPEEMAARAATPLSFLVDCSRNDQAISENCVVIPDFIQEIMIALGVDDEVESEDEMDFEQQ